MRDCLLLVGGRTVLFHRPSPSRVCVSSCMSICGRVCFFLFAFVFVCFAFSASALNGLGYLHFFGSDSVERNVQAAFHFFNMSSTHDFPDAQSNLAALHVTGHGTLPPPHAALHKDTAHAYTYIHLPRLYLCTLVTCLATCFLGRRAVCQVSLRTSSSRLGEVPHFDSCTDLERVTVHIHPHTSTHTYIYVRVLMYMYPCIQEYVSGMACHRSFCATVSSFLGFSGFFFSTSFFCFGYKEALKDAASFFGKVFQNRERREEVNETQNKPTERAKNLLLLALFLS